MSDSLKRVAGEVTGGSWARLMTKERGAPLTELSVLIDDQVVPGRRGRGRRPELTDSELLCLAVVQMLLGHHKRCVSESHQHGKGRSLSAAAAGWAPRQKRADRPPSTVIA